MLILFAVYAVSKGVPISHLRDTFLATDTFFFKALLSKEKRKKKLASLPLLQNVETNRK